MVKTLLAMSLAASVMLAPVAQGRTTVEVGEIMLPSMSWGQQKASVSVTNNTDMLRFITVIAETQFLNSYLRPNRNTRNHFYLEPGASRTVEPVVLIPTNYGRAEISVTVYDVVDTLDALSDHYRVAERKFTKEFSAPLTAVKYLRPEINLPPRVEDHPYFDNHLSRILIIMIDEGKMPEQIAALTGFDKAIVQDALNLLMKKGYVRAEDGELSVTFPIIGAEEARVSGEIAQSVADSLTRLIQANLDDYQLAIDSLVAAREMSADTELLMNPGGALHRLYPTIGGLLLWFDLGQEFITRSAPLLIYDQTDLCNADIPTYMYAVLAGEELNGNQFYDLNLTQGTYSISYSDRPPSIVCPDDFLQRTRRRGNIRRQFGDDSRQQRIIFDTSVVRPAIEALAGDADSLLYDTYYELRDVATSFGHPRLGFGQRYWFWNLVATRTLAQLVDAGVITREGNGHFKFEGWRR